MKKLVIGISGASGVLMGIRILERMKFDNQVETHLIITDGARKTIQEETDYKIEDILALADVNYSIEDIGASIASGTFEVDGMIVVPCSMKTLAGIASGFSNNLLLRAADVTLKERRRLVLLTRETPLSRTHIRNMKTVADDGAIILPPVLSFYNKPESIEDMITHIIGKALNIFGIQIDGFKRWS